MKARIDSRAAETATQSLEKLKAMDVAGVRSQVQGLNESLTTQDFSKAKMHAEKVDEILSSEVVAESVDFLRIEAVEGSGKAKEAMVKFMEAHGGGLDETRKTVCQALVVFFDNQENRNAIVGIVGLAVYLSEKVFLRARSH